VSVSRDICNYFIYREKAKLYFAPEATLRAHASDEFWPHPLRGDEA